MPVRRTEADGFLRKSGSRRDLGLFQLVGAHLVVGPLGVDFLGDRCLALLILAFLILVVGAFITGC